MDLTTFIIAFVSIFVIVNPISGLFTFMSMSSGYPQKTKNMYAKKSVLLAMAMAMFFAVAGSLVLSIFNISIDMLRIAGGMILLSVGFKMMTAKVNSVVSSTEVSDSVDKDFWVFPIATPLLCGPGTISTVIVLTGGLTIGDVLAVLVAIALVYAIAYLMFRSSEAISRRLSYTGMLVITRLLGLLLAAIAVGMILAGVESFVTNLLRNLLSEFIEPLSSTVAAANAAAATYAATAAGEAAAVYASEAATYAAVYAGEAATYATAYAGEVATYAAAYAGEAVTYATAYVSEVAEYAAAEAGTNT
ncbi:MAG: MarC family protein [Methanosarcinales archaeon]|jgi:multiple antibiotic resistance protein|nr:MarC family protein [Methanosarcinales archaeon]